MNGTGATTHSLLLDDFSPTSCEPSSISKGIPGPGFGDIIDGIPKPTLGFVIALPGASGPGMSGGGEPAHAIGAIVASSPAAVSNKEVRSMIDTREVCRRTAKFKT